jgi:hypothetical protein
MMMTFKEKKEKDILNVTRCASLCQSTNRKRTKGKQKRRFNAEKSTQRDCEFKNKKSHAEGL